ncbi:MAG: PD40 domain-containing protein [Candidatus Eisenbacteria bacterium]|uniref:PD40 domain-containing protein n=1 Tax=Eiseniibacteriota bacterium TaxID=2212470 RepID=A0A9D6L5K6_UNCEI|nr:PD40 domain-containing protein [Candidatus Eisenbacteria bacterium]MBI3540252.1 PD40 domain-containing protein [Candidatus Eisenbacteria bacterium]
MRRHVAVALGLIVLAAAPAGRPRAAAPAALTPPMPGAVNADSTIRDGETHFAHLWQLTFGGQNAEAYWSEDGRRLILQSTRDGYPCDQEFVIDLTTGATRRVSTGTGRTTCGYFYDHDRRIFFSSTHLGSDSCPPPLDYSKGYVWRIDPDYDIFTARPDGSDLRRLTTTPGYDAEGTLSPDGERILFTSVRDGDLELYTMRTDGSQVTRLTHRLGYDGGAFFSRDGKWICWRADYPSDSAATEYKDLLARHLVRPSTMNLWVMRADGSDARQVTHDPGASFAPYFTPDGKALIYSSNWENPHGRNFDLYLVDLKGGRPVPVTRDPSFDGFPMFSPDGRWLAFSSNRGGKVRGETNLFLAEWKP